MISSFIAVRYVSLGESLNLRVWVSSRGEDGRLHDFEFPASPRVLYFYIVELFYHAVAGEDD